MATYPANNCWTSPGFLNTDVVRCYLLRGDEEKARKPLDLLSRLEQARERMSSSS